MSLDYISGVQTASWGAPVVIGFINQSADLSIKPALKPTIKNEVGVVITRGYGDMTSGLKVNLVFSGTLPPTPGTTFSFSGLNWLCEGSDIKWKNDGWVGVDIEGIRSEGLQY